MVDLMTSGLSRALLAADSSAKTATQPMTLVSREMQKRNPNMEIVERAGKYGSAELKKADKSLNEAQEELKKAQKLAREEKKAEDKAKLEEKIAEKAAEQAVEQAPEQVQPEVYVESSGEVIDPAVAQTPDGNTTVQPPQVDTLEMSPEALLKIPQHKKIVVDIPKTYTPTRVAVTADVSPQPKMDVTA